MQSLNREQMRTIHTASFQMLAQACFIRRAWPGTFPQMGHY